MTDGYKQPVSDWNFHNLDPTRPVSGFNNHKPSLAAEVDVVDSISKPNDYLKSMLSIPNFTMAVKPRRRWVSRVYKFR
jgi:hypothetical protein